MSVAFSILSLRNKRWPEPQPIHLLQPTRFSAPGTQGPQSGLVFKEFTNNDWARTMCQAQSHISGEI